MRTLPGAVLILAASVFFLAGPRGEVLALLTGIAGLGFLAPDLWVVISSAARLEPPPDAGPPRER